MEIKDGFIAINKEKGFTSHDCVKQIRKLLGTKKVGHTGTLDPEVTGTLPIAIGSATKFIQYLPQEKTYIGQIQLGIRTKTDDIQGEILNKKDWPVLSHKQLDKYLNNYLIVYYSKEATPFYLGFRLAYHQFLFLCPIGFVQYRFFLEVNIE